MTLHDNGPAMTPPSLAFVALVPLVAWRIYMRVRRNIGQQKSRLWRHWAGTALCPILLVTFALAAMRSADAEIALLGGIAGGLGLGTWGLRLTRFTESGGNFYYTPNPYLGVGLSALLIARVAWRFYEIYQLQGTPPSAASSDLARSPLTLLLLGVVFCYYATYSFGLLRWRRSSGRPAASTSGTRDTA